MYFLWDFYTSHVDPALLKSVTTSMFVLLFRQKKIAYEHLTSGAAHFLEIGDALVSWCLEYLLYSL